MKGSQSQLTFLMNGINRFPFQPHLLSFPETHQYLPKALPVKQDAHHIHYTTILRKPRWPQPAQSWLVHSNFQPFTGSGPRPLWDGRSFLVRISLLLNCILLINVKPVGKLQEGLVKSWASHIVWQEAAHGWGCRCWVRVGMSRDLIQSCLVQTDMKSAFAISSIWSLFTNGWTRGLPETQLPPWAGKQPPKMGC